MISGALQQRHVSRGGSPSPLSTGSSLAAKRFPCSSLQRALTPRAAWRRPSEGFDPKASHRAHQEICRAQSLNTTQRGKLSLSTHSNGIPFQPAWSRAMSRANESLRRHF
jgi:hypothetical protein